MQKKISIVIILLLLIISPLLYGSGYYNGARKAFLFKSTANTAESVNTIIYIDNHEYEKARSVQLSELEAGWATISDISYSRLNIKTVFSKYLSFRKLLSFDEKKYIERARECHNKIIKEATN